MNFCPSILIAPEEKNYFSFNGSLYMRVGVGTSYTDDGLAPSTKYNYRVRAYNTAGNSPFTQAASGTTTGIGTTFTVENAQKSAPAQTLIMKNLHCILTLLPITLSLT